MNNATRDFLGVGWKFPLQVTPNGRVALAEYEQRIEESIYLILSTARGERLRMPDFGCGIQELVFAPNNVITTSEVVRSVRESLLKYEARIDVVDVQVETSTGQPNLMLIRIDYRIRANNALGNIVYPFYINEGS